jgi:hypothetical protein
MEKLILSLILNAALFELQNTSSLRVDEDISYFTVVDLIVQSISFHNRLIIALTDVINITKLQFELESTRLSNID